MESYVCCRHRMQSNHTRSVGSSVRQGRALVSRTCQMVEKHRSETSFWNMSYSLFEVQISSVKEFAQTGQSEERHSFHEVLSASELVHLWFSWHQHTKSVEQSSLEYLLYFSAAMNASKGSRKRIASEPEIPLHLMLVIGIGIVVK